METIICQCGCGQRCPMYDGRGRLRQYVRGHTMKGRKNPGRAKPNSTNKRTGRWRARLILKPKTCTLAKIGGCSGRVEVHHKDGNPMNNDAGNLVSLCTCHHRLVENGRIDLANPVMPAFVIRGGKRRYLYSYSATPLAEACKIREAKKREAKRSEEE